MASNNAATINIGDIGIPLFILVSPVHESFAAWPQTSQANTSLLPTHLWTSARANINRRALWRITKKAGKSGRGALRRGRTFMPDTFLVRELLRDGHPTACADDAAFAHVDAFKTHVNVGFSCAGK